MKSNVPDGYVIESGVLKKSNLVSRLCSFEGEHLDIPEGVTCIDEGAFTFSEALKSVSFPDSLEAIGTAAFASCTALQKILFPPRLRVIGPRAFAGCTSLREIRITDSLEEIGDSAFEDDISLDHFCLPGSLKVLGKNILSGCLAVPQDITVPDRFLALGISSRFRLGLPNTDGLFIKGDTLTGTVQGMRSIAVPEGIRAIGANVLRRYIGVKLVSLPSTLRVIRRNHISNPNQVTAMLPSGYFAQHHELPILPNMELFQAHRKSGKVTLEEAASVFLVQNTEFSHEGLEVLQAEGTDPGLALQAVFDALRDPVLLRQETALRRAAVYLYSAGDVLGAPYIRQLTELLTEAGIRPKNTDWASVIQDMVLADGGVRPNHPAFEDVLLADGSAAASPALIKEVLTPYVASGIMRGSPHASKWPVLHPQADETAKKLRLRTLQRVLPDLLAEGGQFPAPLLYAYCRFASDAQMAEIIRLAQECEESCRVRGVPNGCPGSSECLSWQQAISLSSTPQTIAYAARACTDYDSDKKMRTNLLSRMMQHNGNDMPPLFFPPELGLDQEGVKTCYDIFNRPLVQIVLEGGEFLYRNCHTGKTTKTIPKALADYRHQLKSETAFLERYYDALMPWLSRELHRAWVQGTQYAPETWSRIYRNKTAAKEYQGTIWKQRDTSFQLRPDGAFLADGAHYNLQSDAPIYSAAPADLTAAELDTWRHILAQSPASGLHDQLDSAVYSLEYLQSNPYSGCTLSKATRQGIKEMSTTSPSRQKQISIGQNWRLVLGSYWEYADTLEATLEGSGPLDRGAHFALFYLDRVTFAPRAQRDDISLKTFIRGVNDTVFHKCLQSILQTEAPALRALVLEEAHRRGIQMRDEDFVL